jgi:hypothetical protein
MPKGQDILAVLGAAPAEEPTPSPPVEKIPVRGAAWQPEDADPSLDVLVARTQLLEQQVQLQAQLLQSLLGGANPGAQALLEGKEAAVQGLVAAQEQLQKLREQNPVPEADQAAILTALHEEVRARAQQKQARFRDLLASAKKREVINPTGIPQQLTVNGVTVMLEPGANTVPEPFAQAWEDHLELVQHAAARDADIQGMQSFGRLEDWIHAGRDFEDTEDRTWVEE